MNAWKLYLIEQIRKIGTEYSLKLADEINELLELVAEFDVEREIEKSKLN